MFNIVNTQGGEVLMTKPDLNSAIEATLKIAESFPGVHFLIYDNKGKCKKRFVCKRPAKRLVYGDLAMRAMNGGPKLKSVVPALFRALTTQVQWYEVQ
jgi:hypothetical protein